MSTNRIVGLDGRPMDGGQGKPPTAEERIALAENLWNCGKKTEAFQAALNAVAFACQAIHGIGKNFMIIDTREQALAKSQQELAANDQMLSQALAALSQRVAALEARMGPLPGDEWKEGK